MKGTLKRVMSGVLSVITIASAVAQPMTAYAAEPEKAASSFEAQYPELEAVKDKLAADEILTANDYSIDYGSDFDIKVDFSGIEGINDAKVKVELYEAKNEAGDDFDTYQADTYKTVYKVEPVSGNPSYRISRNVTVKEPETEQLTEPNTSENTVGEGNAGETEDSGNAEEDADAEGQTEIVTDLPEEEKVTTDEESGLTVSEVMDQAEDSGIDLYSMEEGEAVTFMAREASSRSTKKVTVTRGACYQYSDYGYGSYLTYKYTVKFGNVSATAYCIQPEKSSPGTGTYDITKLSDGKKLAKVCYYGTKAAGDEGFFTEENGYGNLSAGARFILVHLAASYANGGDSAFSGASSKAKTLAMKLYNYCISQPEIPDVDMSFSDANVTAYVDGSSQRTKEITFKADKLQSITMKLPSGVKLHNVTTGKTSKAGEAVEIIGGTKFYLSAPLTQVQDVAGSWSATMKGSVTKDYSAYKISTGSGSQDLALVFGEGVDDEKYVDFKVTWVQYASVKVIKKDAKANAKLAGAVFGLYSDANCTKLITKLPATDANKNLCMAAVCRAQADWLIGMNGTRAYTTRYFKRLVVGRVQTPTLAMLAERQERIEHFQKEAFYKVALTDGKLTVVSENIANEETAELLAALCHGSTAVVTQVKKEHKKAFPPRLYDLTSLQREANRYFGYTAKCTLDMLQELYEEKLVTYPRTDSQFVTEDMKDSVEELVGKMPVLLSFVDYGQLGHGVKRVINNAKVSDHHAILPTKEAVEKGISDLPSDKKNLMMLICQQLVQATGEEYLYEQTDITVKCQEQDFKARGKIPVQMGFKEVEKAFKQLCVKAEPVEGKEKETPIPAGYEEGMRLFPVKADKTTHYTSPPKPFNEDTLLAAMETAGNKEFDSETEKKGLGTPATRASIIEKLVSSGYAQRKGKQILPSTEGKELVKVMPEYLKSAVMTAEWENQLLMMEKGQITDTQFMGEITSLVRKILEVCREIPEEERRRFQTAREVIGKCPVCGCDVFEGKQNFYCSNRQCDFALWKENRFLGSMEKNLDKKMARELLDKACTHVKGLYSKKKDMKFDADLLLTLEDGKPRFHLEFPKKKKK